ncbi:hypothetical protein MMR14E_19860 [Methylobacterium mesophilicum]
MRACRRGGAPAAPVSAYRTGRPARSRTSCPGHPPRHPPRRMSSRSTISKARNGGAAPTPRLPAEGGSTAPQDPRTADLPATRNHGAHGAFVNAVTFPGGEHAAVAVRHRLRARSGRRGFTRLIDAGSQTASASDAAASVAGSIAAVTRRLDSLPMTRLHAAALAVCTLGLFTDIAEVALSNALAAIFLAPPHNLPRGSLSLLLASVFAGGAVGAPVFGMLGDRLGRRRALQASLALMAAGSLAAAASQGLTALTIARTVSGFAIGGFPPLVATYLAEVTPARRRGATLLVCAGLGLLGGLAAIGLVQMMAPAAPLGIEPWRWALILGGALAALVKDVGNGFERAVPEIARRLVPVEPSLTAQGDAFREALGGVTLRAPSFTLRGGGNVERGESGGASPTGLG